MWNHRTVFIQLAKLVTRELKQVQTCKSHHVQLEISGTQQYLSPLSWLSWLSLAVRGLLLLAPLARLCWVLLAALALARGPPPPSPPFLLSCWGPGPLLPGSSWLFLLDRC